MIRSPTVRDDGSGNPTLVKHAIGDGCRRLRHEAEILVAADGANVVEVVGLDANENRCELSLRYLEAATLAEHPALDLADLLRVLAQIGIAISELHRRGICHGALNRDHILLEPHGSPVLCGFGDATGPKDLQQHPPATDLTALAALTEIELTRTEQMAASGVERRHCGEARAACHELAASAAAATDGFEPLSTWLVRIGDVRASVIRERHSPVGDSVRKPSPLPGAVPGQRDLRDLLGLGASSSGAEGIPRGGARPPVANGGRSQDRRRLAAVVALACAVLVVAFVGWQMLADRGMQESPDDAAGFGATLQDASTAEFVSPQQPRAIAVDPTLTPSGSEAAATRLTSSLGSASPSAAPGRATLIYEPSPADCVGFVPEPVVADAVPAESEIGAGSPGDEYEVVESDVDGDGCPDEIRIAPAAADRATSTITTPFGRWNLGAADDLISVGDWNCDGRATLALVRSHGGVAAFYESWPRSARSVVPARIVTIPRHATAVSVMAAADELPLDDVGSTPAPALDAASEAASSCDILVIHYGEMAIEVAPRDLAYDKGLDLNTDIG